MNLAGPPRIVHVDRLELSYEPMRWAYADENRRDIDAVFKQAQAAKPALFNGRVLVMHRSAVEGGVMSGGFLETDYASFTYWVTAGRPDAGICDCFGAAAVMSADGAFLLGEMASHTFSAGQIYFPCGTPDANDIVGRRVDFDMNVRRELKEETGIDDADLSEEAGWTLAIEKGLVCAVKVLRSPHDAVALRTQMLRHLARERQPELADIKIIRGEKDFSDNMLPFARRFLKYRFAV